MGTEIERKFLVSGDGWQHAASRHIRQGYLSLDTARTVRVRVVDEDAQAHITIKGVSVGATRSEFEYAIPYADGLALLALCLSPLIEKRRYTLDFAGAMWVVDVFEGANAGLRVAEVELTHAEQAVSLPPWVGAEVTDDARYFNANLVIQPFSAWSTAGDLPTDQSVLE
jgi:CYTH domain-containing protein